MSYNLVYDFDTIMPLQLEIPSQQVSLIGLIDDDTNQVNCLHELEFLDECHLKALQHLKAYQKSLCKQYKQNGLGQTFKIGDLALYEHQRNVNVLPNQRGMFSLNWLGPFIITFVYGSRTYGLSKMDCTMLKELIITMHLR